MDGTMNVSAVAFPQTYFPLTLNAEWSRVGRLMFVIACSSVGTIMNGFFVASFFIESTIRKLGNVFLACTGLSEMIITTIVFPISSIILLSGQWETIAVCKLLQTLSECSAYAFNLFFMLAAMESYYAFSRPSTENSVLTRLNVTILTVLIYLVSLTMAVWGTYMEYDYDYCERKYHGNFQFRAVTDTIFHGIPFIVTVYCFSAALLEIDRRACKQIQYRRSYQFRRDKAQTIVNMVVYVFFVVMWIPYLIVISEYPDVSDMTYYHWTWAALIRSSLGSFFYALFCRNYRRAFAHLFNYCCFKSTLSSSFNSRHRRNLDYRPVIGEVRVHIMHHAIVTSPPRFGSSSRELQEL